MRNLSTELLAALTAGSTRVAFLFEGEFDNGALRLASTGQNLSWDGKTWLANGYFLSADPPGDVEDLAVNGLTVVLSAADSAVISLVLGQVTNRATGKLYLAAIDPNGAVSGTPYQIFTGFLDVPEIRDEADRSEVRLSYESRLFALQTPKEGRYTHEHQRSLYPDDRGLEYVQNVSEGWSGLWGKPRSDPQRRPKQNRRRRGER